MRAWHSVVFIAASLSLGAAATAQVVPVDFSRDVRPLLDSACGKCHGAQKQQGGLRFDRREGAFKQGDSGLAAVTPGHIQDSELIRRLETNDDSERMPLNAPPLSPAQIKTLRAWIEQGAPWAETATAAIPSHAEMIVTDEDRQHWSYRQITAVAPPAVNDGDWCTTGIDRFIRAAQEAQGLRPNSPADRRTLIRRVYFDLIGLPPSPQEVEEFVADSRPTAYESLVERLLNSPHYGERWGRHWLDLTRYADSDGLETDADRPNAYHYRDFVIRALNDDLSYQTFVRWQLAGDEYEPDNPQAIAATGFLTTAPNENLMVPMEEEKLRLRNNELDDTAVTMAAAFLGLTLGCARCHDHKFDAIPTRDYYRLQAALIGATRGNVFLASREAVAKFHQDEATWNERIKPLQKALDDWLAEQQRPHEGAVRRRKIEALSISDVDKALLKEQPDSQEGQRLARSLARELRITDNDWRRVFTADQIRQWDTLQRELNEVQRLRPRPPPMALAITETSSQPQPTWLLARGDFYAQQERVELGFLTVLTGSRTADEYWSAARRDSPAVQSTKQRRALAEWMTDVDQGGGALLARVLVNRVWQHHFGEGLSRTVNDFGVRGQRPSHPELLDWLTQQFISGGWRLKPLHKLIMTSAVYRQDVSFDPKRSKIDPENRLLWRRRPQRLQAEVLRDSVLAVSGALNTAQFGPAFKPPIPPAAMLARNTKSPYPLDARDTPATRRRSVYLFHKRVVQHPFLQVFDGPDASASCGQRSNTTVAPQALALLNDPFLRSRADDFANRLLAASKTDRAAWITLGFRLAVARPPGETELRTSLAFLDHQITSRAARHTSMSPDEIDRLALVDFCQGLFSLNEFIYVD